MGSIRGIKGFTLAVLALSFLGSAAKAQENSAAVELSPVETRAEYPRLDEIRDPNNGGLLLLSRARSGTVDWGTGEFAWQGERTGSGSKSIGTARPGSQWHRAYAADLTLRQNIVPRVALEAGVHLERTHNGVVGGPLLTNPTNSIAQTVYVGARIGDSSFIRLIGFDNGGWSGGATGELANRIANGESPARRGTAIEIGRFDLQPGGAFGEQQLSLRVERGRTAAASSDTSAAMSWRVRF